MNAARNVLPRFNRVLYIENSAVTPAAKHLPSKAVAAKVTRFAALASATPIAQRNLYFSETLLDPTNPLSPTTFFITEVGQPPTVFTMDQPPNITVHSGTVEDWVVENRAEEDHIFHIHQIHFQVLEVNGQPVNDPSIRDTVDIPYWNGSGPYPSVKVRMDFRDPNVAIGCSGSAGTDPGTAKGTYTVVVTGTSGTGTSAIQTTVNVPITIQ